MNKDSNMMIKLTRKRLNYFLIFGIIWAVYSLTGFLFKEKVNWIDYGFSLLAVYFFTEYFHQRKHQYFTLKNGNLVFKRLIGKTKIVPLNNLKSIRKFAGDYILKYDDKEFKINTQIIDPDSLKQFNEELKKYDFKWE